MNLNLTCCLTVGPKAAAGGSTATVGEWAACTATEESRAKPVYHQTTTRERDSTIRHSNPGLLPPPQPPPPSPSFLECIIYKQNLSSEDISRFKFLNIKFNICFTFFTKSHQANLLFASCSWNNCNVYNKKHLKS